MANKNPNRDNLRPSEYKFTKEDCAKGGRNAGHTKRMRAEIEAQLEKGKTLELVVKGLIGEAKKGNVRAFEAIRDTIGEKPVQEILVDDTIELEVGFSDEDQTEP